MTHRFESQDCQQFRTLLTKALRSWSSRGPATRDLTWHGHLTTCEDCRTLLADEQTLDELLELLREPSEGTRLPVGLVERVLARLEPKRRPGVTAGQTDALDGLLGRIAEPEVPEGLGGRVLAHLSSSRTQADGPDLDALLGLVPEPEVPAGLSARVLKALANQHRSDPTRRMVPMLARRRPFALAAAAAVLFSLLAWRLFDDRSLRHAEPVDVASVEPPPRNGSQRPTSSRGPGDPVVPLGPGREAVTEPAELALDVSEDLLLALDVLERWEDVVEEDLDLLLASVDLTDEELLSFDAELGELDEGEAR